MSIVRSLIEKMNGTLEVKSQKDVGSTFIITLPFEVAEEPDTPPSVSSESASIHDLHLLMAEDNEINAEIAKTLLTERDATVVVVPNGLQAVQAFKRSKPLNMDDVVAALSRLCKKH